MLYAPTRFDEEMHAITSVDLRLLNENFERVLVTSSRFLLLRDTLILSSFVILAIFTCSLQTNVGSSAPAGLNIVRKRSKITFEDNYEIFN